MLARVFRNLKSCYLPLIACDALFKVIAFVVLVPLVSLLFRLFLKLSGRPVLADAEIAEFLLHPMGWISFVIMGGALVAVFALEQAVLMTMCIGAFQQRRFRPRRVLLFVASKAVNILRLAVQIVGRLAVHSIPFIAVAAIVYFVLLRQHDINYYLTARPREFRLACLLIGLTAVGMLAWLLFKFAGWLFAMPLLLYEGLSPTASLKESRNRMAGNRGKVRMALAGWVLFNLLLNLLISFVITTIAQTVVPVFSGGRLTLLLVMGATLIVAFLANYATNLIANASLASMLGLLYLDLAAGSRPILPDLQQLVRSIALPRLTVRRVLAACLVSLLAASVVGVMAFQTVKLEDQVQITAHRGGAGLAPENTLAAIRQAIADGTDWVEIDVQESSDGVVMVVHDSDLKKVAGNPVKIWQATAEELQAVDIGGYFDTRFRNEPMPTLKEVLEFCKGKVRVNIELKYYGHNQNLEQRVAELVEQYQMQDSVVIMSLDSGGVARMKQLRPEWTVGLLTAVVAGDLSRAPADFLAVSKSIADRALIRAARMQGKTVSVWTVNDAFEMSAMISRGVDNLITDYPGRAREVLAERRQMTLAERMINELAFYLGAKGSDR